MENLVASPLERVKGLDGNRGSVPWETGRRAARVSQKEHLVTVSGTASSLLTIVFQITGRWATIAAIFQRKNYFPSYRSACFSGRCSIGRKRTARLQSHRVLHLKLLATRLTASHFHPMIQKGVKEHCAKATREISFRLTQITSVWNLQAFVDRALSCFHARSPHFTPLSYDFSHHVLLHRPTLTSDEAARSSTICLRKLATIQASVARRRRAA